jgi:dephospho-CoA kinase
VLIVGLTGGIGSGKSEVARAFGALGVPSEDADAVAHAVMAPGQPGHAAVVAAFGPQSQRQDGTLDRDWLRDHAFSDPSFRATLEGLLHPIIRARIEAAITAWRGPYGLLVVPLLLERGGLRERVDRVLVVDCPEDEQVRRVVARNRLSPETVRRIMATQLSRAERLAQADDVIDNGGELAALEAAVVRLDARYRALAASSQAHK